MKDWYKPRELSIVEYKEVQTIWNRATNYGKKMSWVQFLEASSHIIGAAYGKGLKDGKKK